MRSFKTLVMIGASTACLWGQDRISMGGTWKFALDPGNSGHAQRWYERALGPDSIFLPGDTDQGGYGVKLTDPELGWLTRPYKYEGVAWYQRDVAIPESWRGRRVTLFLERAHWQTEVWVDGKPFGSQNSLTTPHEYELTTALTPGAHRITICINNKYLIDIGRDGHSFAEHTQTNWNGVIGAIELRSTPLVWVDSVALYPDIDTMTLRCVVALRNGARAAVQGELKASVGGLAGAAHIEPVAFSGESGNLEFNLPVKGARLWDEWNAALYRLNLELKTGLGDQRFSAGFGVRRIGARGTQFLLNGRPIFLRGTVECAIFPKTGYPPTTEDEWDRLFRIARSYGLNAFRFHSWCPPEAAFAAADRAGFLLQVELPVWSHVAGRNITLDKFMRAEGDRILKAFGNHPSFTMLCLGNELIGDDAFLDGMVAEFKKADPRRLYTFSADHRRRAPGATSDFYETHQTSAGRLRVNNTRFGATNDGTDSDFSASVNAVPMPLVAHELGQWAVFPSYDEIAKYAGVLKARNLEVFRASLEAHGMLGQAHDFQRASGSFSWRIYKEDMEAALRTPGLGGFFLLQLHDFPGQGEALVGLLDSFWESKGILTPEEFRRFCERTVPLLRTRKFVWKSDENFSARIDAAHYGVKTIENAVAEWSATDDSGRVLFSGALPARTLALGGVTTLGDISAPLAKIDRATHLRIAVRIRGVQAQNDWDVWVYPAQLRVDAGNVLVANEWDDGVRRSLEDGGSVLLSLKPDLKSDRLSATRFLPVFWSNAFFPDQPAAMGVLCDPAHPALQLFPTGMGSDFQWWELMENGRAIALDDAPPSLQPLVQVIDDFHRNHKLGAVMELRVGKGKLMISSLDLVTRLEERPAARQLLYSLLEYMKTERFQPRVSLSAPDAERLLP